MIAMSPKCFVTVIVVIAALVIAPPRVSASEVGTGDGGSDALKKTSPPGENAQNEEEPEPLPEQAALFQGLLPFFGIKSKTDDVQRGPTRRQLRGPHEEPPRRRNYERERANPRFRTSERRHDIPNRRYDAPTRRYSAPSRRPDPPNRRYDTPNRKFVDPTDRRDLLAHFRPSHPANMDGFQPIKTETDKGRRRIDDASTITYSDDLSSSYDFRGAPEFNFDARRPFRDEKFAPPQVSRTPQVTYDRKAEEYQGTLASALKALWDYKKNAYQSLLAQTEIYGDMYMDDMTMQENREPSRENRVRFPEEDYWEDYQDDPRSNYRPSDYQGRSFDEDAFSNRRYHHHPQQGSRRRPRSIQLVRQRKKDSKSNAVEKSQIVYYDVTLPRNEGEAIIGGDDAVIYYLDDTELPPKDDYYIVDYEVVEDDDIEYIALEDLTLLVENGYVDILNPDDIPESIEDSMFYNRQGASKIPGRVAQKPKKTLKVRIKDNSKGAGRRIIRMRIKGLSNPTKVIGQIKDGVGKLKNFRLKDLGKLNLGGNRPSSGYGAPPKRTTPRAGYGAPKKTTPSSGYGAPPKKPPQSGYSYKTPKIPFIYGPPTGGGSLGSLGNIFGGGGGGGGKFNFLDKFKKFNYVRGVQGMNNMLKSTFTQATDALPDLSKAITVMSFLAFSVFVANLGVNAITNTSLGISFGRENLNDWILEKNNFDLDGMITDLDRLFEEDKNETGNINTIVDIVQLLQSSFEKTAREEFEKLTKDLDVKMLKEKQSLSSNEFSKRFLLDETMDPICYRRLLCDSNQEAKDKLSKDQRRKILPFWTFGIGWLKGGQKETATLLENLRAELAGQTNRNCQQLYPNCSENSR